MPTCRILPVSRHRSTRVQDGQLLEAGDFKSIGLSGGVANNQVLRAAMKKLSDKHGILFLAADRFIRETMRP